MGSPLFALVLGAAIAQAAATTVVSTASEFDANMGQLDVVDVVSIELAADLACVSPVSIAAAARLFTVTGQAALTLANVAISGEMNTTISVANEASAALDGVVAAGNAGDTGGFLRAADDATVTVAGGAFSNNSAEDGGVFYFEGNAVAAVDGGVGGNSASSSAGVIYVADGAVGLVRRRRGNWTENFWHVDFGAVFFIVGFSTVVIDGGTFSKNTAVISGVAHVKRGSLLIRGGEFRDNYGDERGGVACVRGEGSELLVTGGTFANNFALEGGVFFVYEGSLNVSGGVFEGNAAAEGGVAKSQNRLVVSGGVFSNNGAEETGGVFHAGDDVAFVEGGSSTASTSSRGQRRSESSVAVARAAPYGGFAYQDLDSVLVVGSAFDGCSSGVAAGVYTGDQARLTVSNSSFSNGAGAYASALYLLDAADVSLDNVVIAGGASTLAMTGSAAVVLDATGGAFRTCPSATTSAALSVAEAAIALTASTFRNNTISGSGAAVALTNRATVAAFECVFASNYASEDGGAVYATFSSEFTSNGSIFVGNVAGRRGGAMRLDGGATVALAPSDVNNSALYGGRFATGIAAILAEHAGDEAAGEDLKHAIVVSAVDAFGNVVKDTATVLSAELTAGSSLSGTVKMGFVDGVATWEAGEPLQLYGHPGGSLEVIASLESTWVAYAGAAFDEDRAQPYTANLTFTFRQCVPGEFLIGDDTGGECILCGVGDYWYSARGSAWSADAACKRCAAGFVCEDFGQTLDAVVTKGGRYRASPRAEKTYECPGARRACPRGNATGAASCASGYAGALRCRSGNNGVIVAVYAVVAVLALGALVAVVFSTTGSSLFLAVADTAGGAAEEVVGWASNAALQKRDSKRFALDDAATTSSLSVYVTKVKVVLNFVQIVSAVPMVFGPALELPGSFAALVRLTGLVSGIDTPKEVVERRRIVTQVCLLFIHLTLPICAYAAVSALVSEEIDYGDGETRRFLRVEPAVATASSQYRSVTRVWAILGIFIYPLGVPALYYTLLKRFERPFMEDDDDLLAEVSGWSVTILLFTTVMLRNGVLLGWIAVVLLFAAALLPIAAFFYVIHRVFNGKYDEAIDDAEAACRRGLDGHGPDEPNKDCSSAPTELLEMITCSANLEEKRGGEPEEGCDVGRSS
ncbi:alpha-ketoglutarate-dependent dioxygenase alkB-like protein [Aureococcus anophagefferens]|nr:alpha-ketoglutarate-dependent dioxygenase alkB-like protein [Aureococcus anophagefferens]